MFLTFGNHSYQLLTSLEYYWTKRYNSHHKMLTQVFNRFIYLRETKIEDTPNVLADLYTEDLLSCTTTVQ